MNPTLHNEILSRVLADADLPSLSQNLVDAACHGAAALARQLDESTSSSAPAAAPPATAAPTASRVYLSEIEVRGFRGIGNTARLTIQPSPGLTLVIGRNGSGKSSFAEALEALLTGTSGRWKDRHQAWKQGWKNLHTAAAPQITARFIGTDDRNLEVSRTWADGAELDESAVTTTPPNDPLADARAAISTFRPFLSYADLGTLLAGEPSRLFDELNGILGLDDLNDAIKLLTTQRKRVDEQATSHKRDRDDVLAHLAAIDHPDALACRTALGEKKVDLDQIESLARGESADTQSDVAVLRQLVALRHPEMDEVIAAATTLRDATARALALSNASAAHAGELAAVLSHALAYHHTHGGDCPACGAGLTPTWSADRTLQLETLRKQSEELDAATTHATQLHRRARAMIQPVPAPLLDAARVGLDDAALLAWQRWSDAPTNSGELADHLERHVLDLIEGVTALRAAATTKLQVLDADWRPAANRVLGWVQAARDVMAGAAVRKALKAAEQWLIDAEQSIRDARFAPIAHETQRIWSPAAPEQ